MPSLADNWIQAPQDVMQQIYERHNGNNTWEKEAEEYFVSRLANSAVWSSIPSLNEVAIKDVQQGQLVRFRGMIQDQMGLELYGSGALVKDSVSNTQKMVTGKFKDELALGPNDEVVDWNSTASRQCYYCVPIPGETPWVKQENSNQFKTDLPTLSVGGKKRPLEEENDHEMAIESNGDHSKRPCPPTDPAAVATRDVTLDKILNFPLPSSDPVACIVKIYSEEEAPLNQVLEVVGVLSFNTPGVIAEAEDSEDFQPPSSVVPRIHTILSRKWVHNNPHLCRHLDSKWEEESAAIASSANNIRDELHGLLAEFLMGDTLAADYVLCYLASRVYTRKDALALGKLSLNLSHLPAPSAQGESYTRSFYNILELLVTKAHYLPMSLQNMNTIHFIPKKDYQENRLISGCLQLSPNTHLVLDETVMTEGQLVAEGVRNVTALGNITSWQKIEYDFSFHQVEFHTDIPVLVLSERRSMLATDAHVPLKAISNGSSSSELISRLEANPELLIRMRNYLTVMRMLPFSLTDAIQEAVQNDFIQSRAPGQASPMSTEDFHLLLVLSRLLALTYGKTDLPESLWQKAKAMEQERKARLSIR